MNIYSTPPVNILQETPVYPQLLPATEDHYTGTINTPTNILSEQKSKITTNPFISDIQKTIELKDIQSEINEIIKNDYNQNMTSSISNLSLSEINKNISTSCIEFMNDCFNKPIDIPWSIYIQIILKKNQRYTYFGILFIFIAIFLLIIS